MTARNLQAGHRVLIWGAAGGLGVFADAALQGRGRRVRRRRLLARRRASSSSSSAPSDYIDRNEFAGMMRTRRRDARGGEGALQGLARLRQARQGDPRRRARHRLRARRQGDVPDVACFTVKPFGKVVICGATSGFNLDFDVRYLWMRQKEILGSHFANAWECTKANELIDDGLIRPVLWRTMAFDGVAEAHQLMHENKHAGQDRDPRRRRPRRARARPPTGPGAIHAEVGA